jgi:hypothetical protein
MKNFRRVNWCLAPGAGARFASFPIRDRKGAWHRARGRDLPAFRFGDRKGAWHRARGRDLLAFRFEIAKVPGTWDGLDGSEAQEGGSPGQAGAEAAQ